MAINDPDFDYSEDAFDDQFFGEFDYDFGEDEVY